MHYLASVAKVINKTHPHLGNLAVMTMLSIKAKKMLIVVAPRGCGKSRISSFVGLSLENACLQDRLSVAGLSYLKDVFNGFQSVVVVDDIAKTQTPYARIATITTLAELVYSHYCKSALAGTHYEIENFFGSAVVNIQPVLLKELVKSDEWEASIQDKTIRYYHLYRPLVPNSMPPSIKINWGISLDNVKDYKLNGKLAKNLVSIGSVQWGLARLQEHLVALLRASAALDGRSEVTQSDLLLLSKVLKPLVFENLVMSKRGFESERLLNANLLAILTEFITYGQFSLAQIASDYKISLSQCYRIMSQYRDDWVEISKSPTMYAPSKTLQEKLKKLGVMKGG